MGWSINKVLNELVVPDEAVDAFYEVAERCGYADDREYFITKAGILRFDPDAMEHMDYLWDEDIQAVLLEAKANGKVVFSSTEGDNRNTWWSYEFVDGVCTQDGGSLKDLFAST